MSVNHYLLTVSEDELASILRTPEEIHALVERRSADVLELGINGVAIVSLTAESTEDPLAFMMEGGPERDSGWVGRYVEGVECEVDMCYGPASWYRNRFLREVATRIRPITVEDFTANCDLDWLEQNGVYLSGWRDPGRKESLIESFTVYRACILNAAKSGQHLLVWCA